MRITTQRVRELCYMQTEAEKVAWHLLRDRRMGFKFCCQYPIENYVVDFYCCECRLAIDLDGGVHSQSSQICQDAAKDASLGGMGILVLMLPNGLVMEDLDGFVRKVRDAAARRRQSQKRQRSPHPSAGASTLSPRRGLYDPVWCADAGLLVKDSIHIDDFFLDHCLESCIGFGTGGCLTFLQFPKS